MPSKKKKYNTRFPPARIKKIMQTDEEVGKVAAAVPVIISRALELFLESLVKSAGEVTTSRNAKTLTTSHVKTCVLANENLQFLKSLVDAVPDIQPEEEMSGPCTFEGQIPSNNYHTNSSTRGRKPRERIGNAGPSHSAVDDSEAWSADEDAECSTESCGENTAPSCDDSSQVPTSSSYSAYMPRNVSSANPNEAAYCSTTDDDYDL